MSWHARLQLDYTVENARTVARYEHDGPLRILQSLYPEGDAICHNVLVHPPGGLVGGDTLDITSTKSAPARTPSSPRQGATRFYRSTGPLGAAAQPPDLGRGCAPRMAATGGPVLQRLQCREPTDAKYRPRRRMHGLGRDRAGPAPCRPALRAGSLRAAPDRARPVAGARRDRRGRRAPAAKPPGPGRPALHGQHVLCRRQRAAAQPAAMPRWTRRAR